MPDLVGASTSGEFEHMGPVSVGLRELGSRLEELDIYTLITSDLFPSGAALTWPYIQHLYVEFHPYGPDGRWYFSGPRGEDPDVRGFAITREEHYPPGQENEEETHQVLSDEADEYWAIVPSYYTITAGPTCFVYVLSRSVSTYCSWRLPRLYAGCPRFKTPSCLPG